MNPLFKEEQKYTQWWLWLILIGLVGIPVYGIYRQVIMEEYFWDNPISDIALILISIFTFTFIVMFLIIKFDTEIDRNEIRMHFYPFVRKEIKWEDIQSANLVNHGFQGGWGVRYSVNYGTIFNIKGNKGLALVLKNGEKLCIGTQKENELVALVEIMLK